MREVEFSHLDTSVSASCEGVEAVVADCHRDVRTNFSKQGVQSFPVLEEKHPVIGVKIMTDNSSAEREELFPAFLPGRDDVDFITQYIGQIIGLCREYPLNASGKIKRVYAVSESHRYRFSKAIYEVYDEIQNVWNISRIFPPANLFCPERRVKASSKFEWIPRQNAA